LKIKSVKKFPVYSNKLRFTKDGLIPHFPFMNKKCRTCGHCKASNLLSHAGEKDSFVVYIGDGHSDICPAQYADIVFAKEALLEHYRTKPINCLEYSNLKDVYNYLKRRL
jgi:2-hydroxy-3-keto-5-methylthiopentenyl-1-phosphate phosphatase